MLGVDSKLQPTKPGGHQSLMIQYILMIVGHVTSCHHPVSMEEHVQRQSQFLGMPDKMSGQINVNLTLSSHRNF